MILKHQNTRVNTDYRERGSHARSVYPTQDTSRIGTARVKRDQEADTRIVVVEQYEIWKKGKWARRGKSQTRPN